jgi:predicted murein hydrolase (TIGR00659 family)
MQALSLLVTLSGFLFGVWLAKKVKSPLINPVVIGVLSVLVYFRVTQLDFSEYKLHTQSISTLLGPAVVALALPLYEKTDLLKRNARAILVSVALCCIFVAISGFFAARLLRLPVEFLLAMTTRGTTAAIAMGLADKLGGVSGLSAALAILCGMLGATLGPLVLSALRVKHPLARGLAMGTVSHGIGTAKILEESEESGAAGALGMGLAGALTALILPWLWPK